MKKTLFLLALLSHTALAQTVQLKESVATQLIFPSNIEHHRGGFNPDDFVKPQVYSNILYIQPVTSFETSNISVITVDGCHYSIKLEYNSSSFEDYYVVTRDMAIYNSKEITPPTTSQLTTQTEIGLDPVVSKILTQRGFISTRNAVKYKSLILSISGVYSSNGKIYIRLVASNSSQIPYVIEHVGFMLTAQPTSKIISDMNEILTPQSEHYTEKTIKPNDDCEMIFSFNKFTIGEKNMLLINLVENGGARNITLKVTDEILLTAKSKKQS